MKKKRNKKRARKRQDAGTPGRFAGLGTLFRRDVGMCIVPAVALSALCVIMSAVASAAKHPAVYAIFAVSAVVSVLSSAVISSARMMRGDVSDMADKAGSFGSDAFAMAKFLSALALSAVSAAGVFCAVILTSSVTLSAASALAALSAGFYLALAANVTSSSHSVGSPRERRGFILGFAGVYTVGLLVLLVLAVCFSRIPLGDDFNGESLPEKTLLALSALYLSATAIRSVYLYFMLRRRMRRRMELR